MGTFGVPGDEMASQQRDAEQARVDALGFPPLPPNSHDWIKLSLGHEELIVLPLDGHPWVPAAQMRRWTAARCYYEWRKEANHVFASMPAATFNHTRDDGLYSPCPECAKMLARRQPGARALANADAWARWGENASRKKGSQ